MYLHILYCLIVFYALYIVENMFYNLYIYIYKLYIYIYCISWIIFYNMFCILYMIYFGMDPTWRSGIFILGSFSVVF